MRTSYTYNNCNEVAITYNIRDNDVSNKYKIVKGNIDSVNVGNDEKTKALLKFFVVCAVAENLLF